MDSSQPRPKSRDRQTGSTPRSDRPGDGRVESSSSPHNLSFSFTWEETDVMRLVMSPDSTSFQGKQWEKNWSGSRNFMSNYVHIMAKFSTYTVEKDGRRRRGHCHLSVRRNFTVRDVFFFCKHFQSKLLNQLGSIFRLFSSSLSILHTATSFTQQISMALLSFCFLCLSNLLVSVSCFYSCWWHKSMKEPIFK